MADGSFVGAGGGGGTLPGGWGSEPVFVPNLFGPKYPPFGFGLSAMTILFRALLR